MTLPASSRRPVRRLLPWLVGLVPLAAALAAGTIPAGRVDASGFVFRTVATNVLHWWARTPADVDGDGWTDVLVQDGNGHGGTLGWLRLRPGEGPGELQLIARAAPGGAAFAAGDLAAADIDGDGDPDVLGLAHPGEWKRPAEPTEIFWYRNPRPKGDPARSAWEAVPIGRVPAFVKDVRLADCNGDGRPDVIASTFIGNRLVIFRQDDPLRWTKVQDIAVPNLHEGLDVGDITGDGRPDLAANGYWIENPGGDLAGAWTVRVIDAKWHSQTGDWSRNATKVCCRDLDGDGRAEVVLAHSERAGFPVSWYGAADPRTGPWTEHVLATNLSAVHTLQVADFDGDGRPDVLAGVNAGRARALGARSFPILLFRNQAGNAPWPARCLAEDGIYNGQIADVDGNGALDIFRLPAHDATLFQVLLQVRRPAPPTGDDSSENRRN